MKPTDWVVLGAFLLVLAYFTARLAASAWYRSRREHLVEMARIFGKAKRTPLKPLDKADHNDS